MADKKLTELGALADVSMDDLVYIVDAPGTSPASKKITIGNLFKSLGLLYYGVSWDEATDIYTRTGGIAGQPTGMTLPDALLPVQRRMRRCLLANNGTVNYYLSAIDSTKKEDGVTASVLTGADGQVMVEIPKFWYRYGYEGTVHTWEISPMPLAGFKVHPAFLSGATELSFVYVGAYEAVLYDTSGAAYTDGGAGQVKDWTATTGDVLSSISGKLAVTNGTRAQFRAVASNRGAGWSQWFRDVEAAIQLLFLTEYASFYSQSVLGAGISAVIDWSAYNAYYPIAASGNSNVIGNASGNTAGSTACATEASKYMSYRGIENWYGHLWKFVDGFNVNNNIPYLCNVIANFADDTASNYTNPADVLGVAVTLHNADGWQATLKKCDRGFLPATVGASGSTKITDYYYQAAGWRVAYSGGGAHYGVNVGGFCLDVADAAAFAYSHVGSRVCFRK